MKHIAIAAIITRIILAAAAIFAAVPVPAAEITVQRPQQEWRSTQVYLRGGIEKQDDVLFKEVTDNIKGPVTVILDSRGGDLGAAMRIGDIIRAKDWWTHVSGANICNSACAVIWFSGAHRYLGLSSRIGVHSAGMSNDASKRNDWGNQVVAAYLRTMGVPGQIIERMKKAEPTDIDYIYHTEARSLGLLVLPPVNQLGRPMPIPPAGATPPPMKLN